MRNRLRRWWNVAPLWPICFSILFGKDVAKIDVSRPLDLFSLAEMFSDTGSGRVVYPEMLPVIASMLKAGLGDVAADQGDDGARGSSDPKKSADGKLQAPKTTRVRSLSLSDKPTEQGMCMSLPSLSGAGDLSPICLTQYRRKLGKRELASWQTCSISSYNFSPTCIQLALLSETFAQLRPSSRRCLEYCFQLSVAQTMSVRKRN